MRIYGLFNCSCSNSWTNIYAKEGVPQECNDCHNNVIPLKAMFGRFKCGCGNEWQNNRAVEGLTQKCRECEEHIKPTDLDDVRLSLTQSSVACP